MLEPDEYCCSRPGWIGWAADARLSAVLVMGRSGLNGKGSTAGEGSTSPAAISDES
jgi:hypothetical protein